MKSMKSMKRDDIMKMDGIMEKLYVGLDIHEKYITGTVMRKDGEIAFGGNFTRFPQSYTQLKIENTSHKGKRLSNIDTFSKPKMCTQIEREVN